MFDMRAGRRGFFQWASGALAFFGLPAPHRKREALPTTPAVIRDRRGRIIDPDKAVERLGWALQYTFALREENFNSIWGPDAPAQLSAIQGAIKDAAAALGVPRENLG
jgi:hypothetical protein